MDATIRIEHGVAPQETRALLESLPDWFGWPEAIAAYAAETEHLTCVAMREAGRLVGIASLKPVNRATCEIAVMALAPEQHGRGHGREIAEAAFDWMGAEGFRLALVRTLGPSDPDPSYARTRGFYASLGFLPLVEIADLFGEGTPALLMVRTLNTAD